SCFHRGKSFMVYKPGLTLCRWWGCACDRRKRRRVREPLLLALVVQSVRSGDDPASTFSRISAQRSS
ncbi:MAG: hypothetical protein ABI650_11390, partial [Dokdonella sp.]